MNTALVDVLRGSCLVFCGYGGNDKSIAELLRCLPAKTMDWGVYWVGERFPTGPVGVALRERHETVLHVTHGDFDELMLEVAQEFSSICRRSNGSRSWRISTPRASGATPGRAVAPP